MKVNVFLDLDQTLISAEDIARFKATPSKMAKFAHENMDGYYEVFERPGLQKFLDYLFRNFNVSIWTAASKDYALFIIDRMILQKKGRKLDWIFFSHHCDVSKKEKRSIKHLGMMYDIYSLPGYTKENTVIIDDNSEVYNSQPCYVIRAPAFEYTDRNSDKDNWLATGATKMLKQIEKNYAKSGDVCIKRDE